MQITDIVKSISQKEWLILTLVVIGVLFLVLWTAVFGIGAANDDTIFLGNYHLSTGDTYVYFSVIEEAKEGSLTFHNLFTSEDHAPVLIRPFWLLVGLVAKFFSLESFQVYFIFRILLIPAALFTMYLTIATFIRRIWPRLLAMTLAVSCSGFGFFYYKFVDSEIITNINTVDWYSTPTDLWLTEAFPLLTFLSSPHFLISLCGLFLAIIFFWLGFRNNNFCYLVISGIIIFAFAFIHTYISVYLVLMLSGYCLIIFLVNLFRKKYQPALKTFAKICVPVLIASPALVYQVFIFKTEPVLEIWSQQSLTTSPKLFFYLIGFGILIPLSIIGSVTLFKKFDSKIFFVTIWCWLTFVLLYAPIPFNRRFSEGIAVPLGILATVGLVFCYNRWAKTPRSKFVFILLAAVILAVALVPSNAFNIWSLFAVHKTYKSTPFYLPQAEYESLKWLQENSGPEDIVLSGHTDGFIIPAFTARRVYIGHDLQTANFYDKRPQMEKFFADNENLEEKKEWLIENRIDYVYYAAEEKGLGDFDPYNAAFLEEKFSNELVSIFVVVP